MSEEEDVRSAAHWIRWTWWIEKVVRERDAWNAWLCCVCLLVVSGFARDLSLIVVNSGKLVASHCASVYAAVATYYKCMILAASRTFLSTYYKCMVLATARTFLSDRRLAGFVIYLTLYSSSTASSVNPLIKALMMPYSKPLIVQFLTTAVEAILTLWLASCIEHAMPVGTATAVTSDTPPQNYPYLVILSFGRALKPSYWTNWRCSVCVRAFVSPSAIISVEGVYVMLIILFWTSYYIIRKRGRKGL